MNICNIRRTFEMKPIRGWKRLYVLVDVHGVIIPGSFHRKNDLRFITEDCKEVLQWMTKREDFRIILWTSSRPSEIDTIVKWLKRHKIEVDGLNTNLDTFPMNEYSDFSFKPYFNILIDDKAGFEPATDWKAIKDELIAIGEWDKV